VIVSHHAPWRRAEGNRTVIAMLSVLLLVLALAGCVSLTPDGERVRVVRNSNHVRDCRLLGNVESLSGHGGVAGDLGFENNKATMRNDTAKLGGDTLLVLEERCSSSKNAAVCFRSPSVRRTGALGQRRASPSAERRPRHGAGARRTRGTVIAA
jgi:hypothetical protein